MPEDPKPSRAVRCHPGNFWVALRVNDGIEGNCLALSDVKIKSAKPADKAYKLTDGNGLFLLVTPVGGKWWRLRYRHADKEKMLSLGTYPEVSLLEARNRRDDARKLVASGLDPSAHRKAEKAKGREAGANTFEAVAREWLQKQSGRLAPVTVEKAKRSFENWLFPWIGPKPVTEISARELLAVLQRVEKAGKLETLGRLRERCGQVFRYAIATGKAERDPAADLRGAFTTVKVKHHASITDPKEVGELLRAVSHYRGSPITACALRFAPLVFVRPGELRHAEWSEFDLAAAEWRIPGEKMKMKTPHVVPLSAQAIAVLEEIKPLTGLGRYVFPSVRSTRRPMSENTVLAALRRLGYTKDEMTGHGFRSTASTLLNEQGWTPDAIERQLAHAERDAIRAAYNYAEHLPERRRMMQAWADYLDSLARGADVIPIRSRAA